MRTNTSLMMVTALAAIVAMRAVNAKEVRRTPERVLPVDTARAVAHREKKPLLIVSLNGNLDGNC